MVVKYKNRSILDNVSKKGFTLIELLAVIVILAVIALIATPIILNMINSARKSSAVDSAYGYIKAVEYSNSMNMLDKEKYPLIEDGNDIDITKISAKVNLKGTKPTGGIITIEKGIVKKADLCIDGYSIKYALDKAEVSGTCTKGTIKKQGKIVLSSTNGAYTYPESKTIEVVENLSNGKLICESNNEKVATCKVTENTITITSGKEEGEATLTIKSEETDEYTEGKAVYVAITSKGLLSVTASDYVGEYDGLSHGIVVTSSGSTIKYGTSEGTYDLDESPKYIDAGTYKAYYEVSREGYKTVTGSKTITINKKEGTLTISETSGTIFKGLTTTITASNASGNLSCSTSNSKVATCSVKDTTITINGLEIGTAIITITSNASKNYNAINKTYNATIKQNEPILLSKNVKLGDYIKMVPTSTSYTTDTSKTGYTSTQTINPSELDTWRVIKVNSDETIEVVSENISSTGVYFRGQTGYKNLVGYLNVLANQYQNSKYTIKARHMGYNGQTEYLVDTENTVDSTVETAPWTCDTGGSCNPVESKGGGDTLYQEDVDLVKNTLGTLISNQKSGNANYYWLASRYYAYNDSTYWYYGGRNIHYYGYTNYFSLYGYISEFRTGNSAGRLRPILTLKSGLSATGSGTSSNPYVLQ